MAAKLLLVIGAVLVTTVSLSDGTVTLPQQSNTYQQGRTYTINCQITGETFVGWQTPAKPPRSGRPAIPSETITLSTTGRREVAQVGDNYGLKIKDFTVDDGGVYTCVGSSQSASFTANVDIILIIDRSQTLHLGQTETLVLGVSAYPPLTYTWTKDGQPVTFDARRTLDQHTGSITFSPVQLSDEGNYTCSVSNAVISPHEYEPIRTQVIQTPVINKYQGEPVESRLTQGNNATFHCDIRSGAPNPTIEWWFGWDNKDKKVDRNYDSRFSHPTDEEWTITGIESKDKGKYRCIAENVAGHDELRFQITEVDIPPAIDPPLTDIVVNEGANPTLQCKVTGLPAPTVEWFDKDGVRVLNQWQTTEGNKIVQNIMFTNAQWRNSGKYTCRASNGALDSDGRIIVVNQTISLNVRSPPTLISSPDPMYSFVGNRKLVVVSCEFSGYPVPSVTMVDKNGTEIESGNRSASLRVPYTDSEVYFGIYNCSAVNSLGSADVSLELRIAVAPGPAREVLNETTCKDVRLTWDHPEFDGGMHVTNYVIRLLKPDGEQLRVNTVDGDLREVDIDYNFQPETTYVVELMARNDVGYGEKRTVVATTKKYCVPGKPTITNPADGAEVESTFTLTWSAPAYNGLDNITKYKVQWWRTPKTVDSVIFEEENIGETQLTVTGLEGNAEYEFKVFATNRAGLSKPVTVKVNVKEDSERPTGGSEPTYPSPTGNPTSSTHTTANTKRVITSTGEPTKLTTTAANEPEVGARTAAGLGAGAIAGIVIAVILIVLITIDLFCCFFNSCGVIFCCHQALCGGAKTKDDYPEVEGTTGALGAGPIAGIVIGVILIVLIAIDLFCCFFNSCGLLFCCKQAFCGGAGSGSTKGHYEDGNATEMEKKKLAAQNSNV